jgi:hypothetical protein
MDFSLDSLRRADVETAINAVKQNGLLIQHLPPELRDNANVVNAAFKQNHQALAYVGPKGIIGAIEIRSPLFKNYCDPLYPCIDPKLWSDKEFVIQGVSKNGTLLLYASDVLKEDPEVALVAIRNTHSAYHHVSEELTSNLDFLYSALSQNERVIQCVKDELVNERDFILAAVKVNPEVVKFIPPLFYDDQEIMSIATTTAWRLLHIKVSDRLKNNRDFAFLMVKFHPNSIFSVSSTLRNEKKIVLSIVKENGLLLQGVNERFKSDPEVVGTAINNVIGAFQYAAYTLRGSRDFVQNIAIPKSAYALKYLSEELKNNEIILRLAVLKDPAAFEYAGEKARTKLSNDKTLFMTLIAKDWKAIEYASAELQDAFKFHEDTVREATTINPWMLLSAAETIQDKLMSDSELMNTVIKQHPWAAQLERLIKEKIDQRSK